MKHASVKGSGLERGVPTRNVLFIKTKVIDFGQKTKERRKKRNKNVCLM